MMIPSTLYNLDLEQQLLGQIMANNAVLDEVPNLTAEHFYSSQHREIFTAIQDLIKQGKQANPVTLRPLLEANNVFAKDENMMKYLVTAIGLAVLIHPAPMIHEALVELAQKRALYSTIHRHLSDVADAVATPPAEIAESLKNGISEALKGSGAFRFKDYVEITQEILDDLNAGFSPYSTGLSKLDKVMGGGLYPGKAYAVAARKKVGKAQPLSSMVLLTKGWVPMGKLRIGDKLASVDGKPSQVTGIFPQGEKQIYRVTFSDDRSTLCCAEHLWEVHGYRHKRKEIINTVELKKRSTLSLPTYIPFYHGDHGGGEMPINPYLLGAILGDGGISQPSGIRFSTADNEMVKRIETMLPQGMEIKSIGKYDYILKVKPRSGLIRASKPNPLLNSLRELRLQGKRSEHKFIPHMYLSASKESRMNLIRGLMDTDGYITKKGSLCYDTSSRQLAEDMAYLVRSVGGMAKIKSKETTHLPTYKVKIRHTNGCEFFLLSRKKMRGIKRKNQCRLSIKSVELVGREPAQCISVSHHSQLYITDDFIVTHNTALAATISANLDANGTKHLFICGEMGDKEIHERILSRQTDSFPSAFRMGYGKTQDFQMKIAHAATSSTRSALYYNAPGLTFTELKQVVMTAINKHGITGFILDYWQLVGGKPKSKSTAEHLDEIAQWIADMGRKHKLWSISMVQLNQEGNTRGGEGIRLACDQAFQLHRDDLTMPQAWLEMMETRCTAWMNIGSKEEPGLLMEEKGPYFREI